MEIQTSLISNFLSSAIQQGINSGVPKEYFIYLLTLPLLVSLVAAARHLLGLKTHGVFLPAVIAVVWRQTGLEIGLLFFFSLLVWTWIARTVIRKILIRRFRINYLPRMAILLMFVCLGVLIIGLVPQLSWFLAKKAELFSLLLMVLIVQSLTETQISLSKNEARSFLWETTAFALGGYFLFSWPTLQAFILAHPGLTIFLALFFNIFVGRYVGFRLLEYHRFKSIIR